MLKTKTTLATLGALFITASGALAAPVETVAADGGAVLAGSDSGLTLYTFRKDAPGQSNCYEQCAQNWPPFFAADGAAETGAFTIVTRKDGAKQWALDGKPLYFWINDQAKGDVTGDGVGGVWDAARP